MGPDTVIAIFRGILLAGVVANGIGVIGEKAHPRQRNNVWGLFVCGALFIGTYVIL